MNKRKEQQDKENLPTVDNEVPESRFQSSQQVQTTADASAVKTPDTGFSLEKKESKGPELKQEAVAKVLHGESGSATGMGISGAGTRGVSGASGGVLGASNGTPIADKSRSDSRYGKKLDRIGTKLNFTPSEQVVNNYDESKPLAASSPEDQGYNGTYRNEYARSQKKVGNTPAELMFDRSVDVIMKDELYFSQGQYVRQTGAVQADTPTVKMSVNDFGQLEYPKDAYGANIANYNAPSGNYFHRNLNIKLDGSGRVTDFEFDVVDLTPTVNAERANRSSASALIDRNSAEIDRQNMDAKAGDEKAEIWTPLARAIEEPTHVTAFLRDLEAITGSEVYAGYRKAMTSMSYQLNRAAKDGQTIVDPAVEAIIGTLEDTADADVIATAYPTLKSVIDSGESSVRSLNASGSAGIMIQAYDSTAKYKSKQDIILQPRSFRMHLQTADNNMDPLRVNRRFAQIFSATECFSTIDREYDPLLPICMTDKAALVHRRNLNQIAGFVNGIKGFTFKTGVSGSTQFVKYHVAPISQALSDSYVHVLISDNTQGHGAFTCSSGVFTPNTSMDADVVVKVIIDKHSSAYSTGKTIGSITYYEQQNPLQASTVNGSYIDINVPSDVDAFEFEKTYAIDGGPYIYGYSDLRNNYVVRADLPLTTGIIDYMEREIGAKFYTLLPSSHKITIPCVHSTQYFSLWSFILCAATPFMENARTNSMRDVLYYEKNVGYPFSGLETIGSLGVKSFSNFGCEGYDAPLVCQRMNATSALRWTMPEMFWVAGQKTNANKGIKQTTVVMPFYMNEENYSITSALGAVTLNDDAAAMSMPSIRGGARLAFLDNLYGMSEKDIRLSYDFAIPFIPEATGTKTVTAAVYKYATNSDGIIAFVINDSDTSVNANADISIQEWLTVPRELGWSIDAPYGLLTPKVSGTISTAGTLSSSVAAMSESATRGSSYRIKYWLNDTALAHTSGSGAQDILKANAVNVNRAANFTQKWFEVVANGKHPAVDHGMVFSLNRLLTDGAVVLGESKFKPLYNAIGNTVEPIEAISFMKAFWTRIQKLPFVISPFEGGDIGKGTASKTVNLTYDPYEIAYLFGLCGFRASDYRESIYNREKEVVNKGYLFVNDPWLDASPLFREGGVASGATVSGGYTLS